MRAPQLPTVQASRAPAWRDMLLLIAIALVAYNANLRVIRTGDTTTTRSLAMSLWLDGDLYVDELATGKHPGDADWPPWLIERDGHLLTRFPVTQSLLIAPLYLPAALYARAHAIGPHDHEQPRARALAGAMEKLTASLVAALSVALLCLALRELAPRRLSIFLALLHALTTNTWTIASQALWMHGMVELWLAVTALGLLRGRADPRWLTLAGLGAAMLVAVRPTALLIALPALAYVRVHRRAQLARFMLFPLLIGGALLAFNLALYGHVGGGYGQTDLSAGRPFLNPRPLEGIVGLLVHPSRGLIVYTPTVLLSFWGALRAWRRGGEPVLRFLSLALPAYLLFFGSYSMWMAGWGYGPRYLTDVLPILSLLMVPIAAELKRPAPRALLGLTASWALVVQLTGAFFYEARWDAMNPDQESAPWSVRDSQIAMAWRAGPAPHRLERLRHLAGE